MSDVHDIPGPWSRVAEAAGLRADDGTFSPTIFAQMTALSAEHDAINLGQGFPDEPGPQIVLDTARAAIAAGDNQYPPGRGIPRLREAIARHQERFHGISLDPEREVLVTAGATEAIAAAILALVGDDRDEVVVFEPYYDAYAAVAALAGARLVPVPLEPAGFEPDLDLLREAVTDRTAVILVNDPHNPTGTLLAPGVHDEVIRLAHRHGAYIVTDEVYEHLIFDENTHRPLSTRPGGAERTLTISSAAKTFAVTGWKIGWITGPASLVDAVLAVKQFLTYANGTPFQPAVAAGLDLPAEVFAQAATRLGEARLVLGEGLREAGWRVRTPQATYFTVADAADLGVRDAAAFCRNLARVARVTAIPLTAFVSAAHRDRYASLVRFAACKRPAVLAEAVRRLQRSREAVTAAD